MAASPSALLFGSLPIARTRLIGRESQQALARSLLLNEGVPLLTLTGTGGVGKTRLALALAHDVAEAFADGVMWVDLAPVMAPTLVPTTLAASLAFVPSPSQPVEAQLARHLRPRQVLLLFDNCEHLAPAVADLVSGLLTTCPAVQVLATSRTALHVRGERRLPVDPLSVPSPDAADLGIVTDHAAVQLFVERAQAVQPAFHVEARNAAAVAALCRYLDGLPLAIELAAAWMTVLSPGALLGQMGDRLRVLRGGPRDAPARQRTMRDTIAWSYGLLTPAEQTLFRRLAVFVGGFAMDAAATVCQASGDAEINVLDGLTSLADHHLVHPVDDVQYEPRFTMLETVRAFALEQLATTGEGDVIRGRHAAWYLALAEQSELPSRGGPQQAHWLSRLEAELPNLRGALAWLEGSGDGEAMLRLASWLSGFWFWRSRRVEGSTWLERALAVAGATPSIGRGNALRTLGMLGMQLGNPKAADYAAESVAVWTALGDTWRVADARLALGQILAHQADYERAIPLLEEAAREWDALGNPGRGAVAWYFLGQAAVDHDDGVHANALFVEAMRRFRQDGVAWGISTTLHKLGEVAAMRGDVAAAAAYYAESLAGTGSRENLAGTGSRENLVGKLVAIGRLAAVGAHPVAAARLFGAAEAVAETIGYVRRRPEQERLDRDAASARNSLGDAGYETAVAAGKALAAEQAVADALAVLTLLETQPAAAPQTRPPTAPGIAVLSPREREVLILLGAHLQDREIAAQLFLSPRTVESHVSRILAKLGVSSRREAIAVMARQALV